MRDQIAPLELPFSRAPRGRGVSKLLETGHPLPPYAFLTRGRRACDRRDLSRLRSRWSEALQDFHRPWWTRRGLTENSVEDPQLERWVFFKQLA